MRDACVEWSGGRNQQGYGLLQVNRRRYVAHRWAWEQAHGPIPEGMHVLHRCDNPPCYNVDHLFLGTHQDNMTDMTTKGRARGGGGVGKLRNLDVAKILQFYGTGDFTQAEIADRFDISRGHVIHLLATESHARPYMDEV